jgi:23S rRNA pseudouridine1911/1915/1917 synthase
MLVQVEDQIIFEDNHILLVNKLPGQLVQPDAGSLQALETDLKEYIRKKYNKPAGVYLGVVHRIDRPVSGVVVFAKTSKSLVRLNQMVKDRQIKKIYHAVVKVRPSETEGVLEQFIIRNAKQNKSYICTEENIHAQSASLQYKVIDSSENFFLIEINLITGRHHQIRAQMASIGCPIRGDLKYGFSRSNTDGSISLHARSIEFVHPVNREIMKFNAPYPNDKVWGFFKNTNKSDR